MLFILRTRLSYKNNWIPLDALANGAELASCEGPVFQGTCIYLFLPDPFLSWKRLLDFLYWTFGKTCLLMAIQSLYWWFDQQDTLDALTLHGKDQVLQNFLE